MSCYSFVMMKQMYFRHVFSRPQPVFLLKWSFPQILSTETAQHYFKYMEENN